MASSTAFVLPGHPGRESEAASQAGPVQAILAVVQHRVAGIRASVQVTERKRHFPMLPGARIRLLVHAGTQTTAARFAPAERKAVAQSQVRNDAVAEANVAPQPGTQYSGAFSGQGGSPAGVASQPAAGERPVVRNSTGEASRNRKANPVALSSGKMSVPMAPYSRKISAGEDVAQANASGSSHGSRSGGLGGISLRLAGALFSPHLHPHAHCEISCRDSFVKTR